MNLCMRPKAVAVASPDEAPPAVPEDSTLRGRAQELHHHLSRMREPVIAPRDMLVINLDFDVTVVEESDSPNGTGGGPGQPNGLDAAGISSADGPKALAPSSPGAAAGSSAATSGATTPTGGRPRGNGNPGRSDTASATSASASNLGTDDGPIPTPSKRGYVRVKSVRPPAGLEWTHSRKCLEVLIDAERTNRSSLFQTHEQRLRERLERLNLDMLIVMGDGNCQFRSVSNELYGTQEHHSAIRRQAVSYIVERRDVFEAFLGEDFDEYVRQMARNGTWGDELTLRAVCDSFGIIVHVVTSEADHWYLTYEPESRKVDREIFLTYIAPIHYNSIRRQSSLKTMALNVSRSFRKLGSGSLGPGGRTSSGPLPLSAGPASPVGFASPVGAGAGSGRRSEPHPWEVERGGWRDPEDRPSGQPARHPPQPAHLETRLPERASGGAGRAM